MPVPLTIAARRAMVEQLRRQEPSLSARKIADRLGVSKDTILRGLAEIAAEECQRAQQPAAAEPEPAPDAVRLVLILDEPLRQALAVLRATCGAPDTAEQNEVAAPIRAVADSILEAQRSQRPCP
ncbi:MULTISPECIES: helix-turn-helix domain-containing protein [Streptomyces]|uniref:helix-turn-helix domain-containing protein n=1 Tax=Streptomyces TaxID=1883 RepID=UPI0021764D93|nr:helix-turn-helix domain-containing protein [Streptomyces murinus]